MAQPLRSAASQNRDPLFLFKSDMGPGSAAHRFAKCYALRCIRGTWCNRTRKIFCDSLSRIPEPALSSLPSCPVRDRFLEAIPKRTERKLAAPGAPGSADETGGLRWSAGRRSAFAEGRARFSVPREAGPLIPPQRVPRKHSGASRRSTTLAHFREGDVQTSDASRRENAPTRPSFRGARALRGRTRNLDVTAHTTSGFRVRA
jgi:hypothetical protein